MESTAKQYLKTIEAAQYLNCSKSYLEKSRVTGIPGIPYRKLGRKVLYKISDLNSFLENQKRVSTSEAS